MFDFRLPKITGATDHERILQLESYIYQLIEQLRFVLSDSPEKNSKSAPTATFNTGIFDTLRTGIPIEGAADRPVDLGAIKTPGCYFSPDGTNITGTPSAGGFRLEVREIQSRDNLLQTVTYGARMLMRDFNGETWSDWYQLAYTTPTNISQEETTDGDIQQLP